MGTVYEPLNAPPARPGGDLPAEPEALWNHAAIQRVLAVLNRPRAIDRQRPWLLNTAVVLLAIAAMPPDLLSGRPEGRAVVRPLGADLPVALVLLIGAILVVPLWWRRQAATPVYSLVVPACLALWSLGLGPAGALVLLIALFNLALHAGPRAIAWALPATLLGWVLLVLSLRPDHEATFLVLSIGTGVAAVALGLILRIQRLYLVVVQDRAARLEIERDQRGRLGAAQERARVAREMHDILGHNLSVMVSLADGAAALTHVDPTRSAQALSLIGETGRTAMGELRRVLEVLREDPEDSTPWSPQPGLRDLEPLLERVRAAGLPVTYRTAGRVEKLTSGVQLTLFRIVQEALTNTLKHAGPGAASMVVITVEGDQVRVRVTDTGSPSTAPSRPHSKDGIKAGQGLVGIRHRISLYDGVVTFGARDDAPGWYLEVALATSPSPKSGDGAP